MVGGASGSSSRGLRQAFAHRLHRPATTVYDGEGIGLKPRDPVFDGTRLVGWVADTSPDRITVQWCDPPPAPVDLRRHRSVGSLAEATEWLFPPPVRDRLATRMRAAYREEAPEIAATLTPVLRRVLADAVPAIRSELRTAVFDHRDDLDRLGRRWRRTVIDEQLTPLARETLLPIVRTHAAAPAEAIGRELWERLSLWRFGWRAAYDRLKFEDESKVREEWQRFVEEEVVPVLEQHTDDIVRATQNIVVDAAGNAVVRETLSESFRTVATDPDAQSLLTALIRRSVVENGRLHDAMVAALRDPEIASRLSAAADRAEPIIREMAEEVVGNDRDGISPGLARVLRRQILGRDRRWLTVAPESPPSNRRARIVAADDDAMFPVVHLAE